jgi:hypothetical protein
MFTMLIEGEMPSYLTRSTIRWPEINYKKHCKLEHSSGEMSSYLTQLGSRLGDQNVTLNNILNLKIYGIKQMQNYTTFFKN